MSEAVAVDPVCGKQVDVLRARAVGIFGGVTFYFCSAECKAQYRDPRQSAREAAPPAVAPIPKAAKPVRAVSVPAPPVSVAPAPTVSVAPAATSEPAPRHRWVLPLAGLVVAATAATVVVWNSPPATPPIDTGRSAPTPSPTPAGAVSLDLAPRAAIDAGTSAAGVELKPPLKIGLRRFIDHHDGRSTVSLRLLVIDAAGRASPFEVGRAELATEDLPVAVTAEAIQPREEFAASSTEPGTIFEDSVDLGAERLELRIARRPDALVAETRTVRRTIVPPSGNPPPLSEVPWRTSLHIPLPETGGVRGAAFSRKRYLPDAPDPAATRPAATRPAGPAHTD